MPGVFLDHVGDQKLDVSPFKIRHSLLGTKVLELDSLTEILLRLPKNQVYLSNTRLDKQDDFEATFKKRKDGSCSLESALRGMLHSDSLIMVNSPEVDSAFKPVYEEIMESIAKLVAQRDRRKRILMPTLYLFIASPNSVTPFHIDRYSTFLFQFRGSKKVYVAEPWDNRVVSDANREAYISYANTKLPWNDGQERLFTCFDFTPGECIHIPFVSGHFVKNGSDDISISMSLIFNTENTMMWRRALNFNHRARRILRPLNVAPYPVGRSDARDLSKSFLWQSWTKFKGVF
ncbi:MAG: cupin-like domain-containing protein [Marinobacter sp.]